MSGTAQTRKYSKDEQEELRARVSALLTGEDMTRAQAAAESGIPYGTITTWLSGTYAAEGSSVADKVSRWLEARKGRVAVQQAAGGQRANAFVLTPKALQIHQLLTHAQAMPDMVTITGAPGTGKTSAACEYTRRTPQVFKVVAEPCLSSVPSLLQRVALAVGATPAGAHHRVSGGIVAKLRGTQALLIVDEAQHLSSAMLDQLRTFHDQADCGIALIGNAAVLGRLEGGARSAEFAQLFSRVGMRLQMKGAHRADVDALLDAWKVEDEGARRTLRAVSKHHGALRSMAKAHRLAKLLASADGREQPGAEDVRAAFERLGAALPADAAEAA